MSKTPIQMSDCGSSSIVRACAVIADTVVPYQRIGRGQPVLVLGAEVAPTTISMSDAPRELCVIVPEDVPGGPTFNAWLALFLDALGLQGASIVAIGKIAEPAREFAAVEPDRVRRVFSIRDGESPRAVADVLRSIAGFTVADAPFAL